MGLFAPRQSLLVPRTKVKQPGLIVDRGHFINRGLVSCFILGDAVAGLTADIAPAPLFCDTAGVQFAQHGTIVNGPLTFGPSHHGGLATGFTAASKQAIQGRHFQAGKFTVGGWGYKFASGKMAICGQGNSGFTAETFWFGIGGATTSGFTNPGFQTINTGTEPTLNVWNHFILSYDGAALRYYLNGALSTSAAASGTPSVNIAEPITIARYGSYTTDQFWDGYLERIGVWDRALGLPEIQLLYADPYVGLNTPWNRHAFIDAATFGYPRIISF